jgi:Zn finger protein HypA/HybF involved in hydrogenase expression
METNQFKLCKECQESVERKYLLNGLCPVCRQGEQKL